MEKKIFKVSEPIFNVAMDFNSENEESTMAVKKFNYETKQWETVYGDENSSQTAYLLFRADNQPKPNKILESFCNTVLGIPWKPKN